MFFAKSSPRGGSRSGSQRVLAATMIIASVLGTAGAATASVMSAAPAATSAIAPQDTPWG